MTHPPWRRLDAIDLTDLFDVWIPRTVKAIEKGADALDKIAIEIRASRDVSPHGVLEAVEWAREAGWSPDNEEGEER